MASERAKKGGGREVALNASSYSVGNYQIGSTYGASGKGASWFGPGDPMSPQAPTEVKGRAFDFPQGVNLLTTTRPYSPITYDTLRAFADGYDLLRIVIETRKDAMERLRWAIQPRDPADKLTPQRKNKIKAMTDFLRRPDREHSWNTWLRMLLEDLFVIDAPTLHRRRTRGGTLYSLEQIDGATIRRVLDDWGRTPEGENDIAYQQILKGMPAVDYVKDELYYRPRNLRVHKIYGYSPVEQILMTINIALRRQVFQLDFFTDGNIPAALIGVPEQWTPDQIRTFQEWFDNILSGNLNERRKARFVPSAVGKTYVPTQETELFGKAEEWLARVVCYCFSVPVEPFISQIPRTSDPEATVRTAEGTGLAPIKAWVKDLIDDIIFDEFGASDFEFMWKGDDELDPVKRQAITEANVKVGLLTVNEGRADMGRDSYDDPIFDKPMFLTSNGLAPLALSPDAQGGNTPKPTPEAPDHPKTEQQDSVKKTLESIYGLVKSGDVKLLTRYLSEINQETTQ